MTSPDARKPDFAALPPYRPRRWVPADVDLGSAEAVCGLHQALVDRPVASAADLEQWLLDRSELDAALGQHHAVLYIRMTCQTDDAARAEAYTRFIQTVEPAVAPLADGLDRKYLDARRAFALDTARYGVFDRAVRADVDLFREANVPLKTEVALLSQQYQTVTGAMSVTFEGRERTLPEMHKFLLETDRARREAAWRATARRRLADRDTLDDLFEKMLAPRGAIAANAGCEDYMAYQFRACHRFDYTPADCRAFHDAVARCVVPLARRIH
ncbi:MAG: M3 family oligoendopeptidase, partial [Planctomycetes bacterium]|nr:M3 family oligoendopeptidase [Planctomycetota bacterium]